MVSDALPRHGKPNVPIGDIPVPLTVVFFCTGQPTARELLPTSLACRAQELLQPKQKKDAMT